MSHRFVLPLLVLLSLVFSSHNSLAAPKYLFKIATLAPEGSVWINQFKEFSQEVTDKTGGEVGFKIYPGGIMGDDQAMYRKMRVGQLQGGGFAMTGISQIVPDFRVMALPFFLRSYAEVDTLSRGLVPHFKQRFAEQGMEFIAMTEVGFLYAMSTVPITTIDDMKANTCWTPTGDPVSSSFFSTLGISPVQLSIPDVLSSLQTGLVNTVFNSLYGSIVLQWFTKARYINDTPFGYAYGAFLLDSKAMKKLPKEHAVVIQQSADKYFPALIEKTRASNAESKGILEKQGIQFTHSSPETVAQLQSYREQTAEKMAGTSFSREIYETALELLKNHRAGQSATSPQ